MIPNEVDTTMSGGTFFPNTEAGQVVWLSHYALKLPVHGPACGISDKEIKATLEDIAYYVWMLQHWHPATQHDAKEATAHKIRMISGTGTGGITSHPQLTVFPDPPPTPNPGIKKCLFSQIVRIKASINYNESIGHDLGIIDQVSTTDHPIPEYTLSVEMGATGPLIRIDFKKYGHDGIWIETRTNGGKWAFLAIDTVKPSRRAVTSPRQHPRDPRIPASLVGQERTSWRVERGAEGGGGKLKQTDDEFR